MNKVNPDNIFVGLPDQLTTGAVDFADIGTPIPASINDIDDLDPAFEAIGYVDEDGVNLADSTEFEDIKDWSQEIARRIKTSIDIKVNFNCLELNNYTLALTFGAENVEGVDATDLHGYQMIAKRTKTELPHKVFVFKMKDGERRMAAVFPNAQNTTESLEVEIVGNNAIKIPVELTIYPDEDGFYYYLYTDDGKKIAVGGE